MKFVETRGNDSSFPKSVEFSEAILSPIASFGGLYVPENIPTIDENFLNDALNDSYKTLALKVLKLFNIDINNNTLNQAVNLYDKFDQADDPIPLIKIKDDLFICELYHGPTRAFKDIALQPFGLVLSAIAKKRDEKYLIMAATSGDTGPAALETFKEKENIRVVCLYPEGGTSDVQRLQMVTENGSNLKVVGIKGVFDDAQNALKSLLASDTFKAELKKSGVYLSAANSVNFGRIIFQIIYHIYAYIRLLKQKEITLGEKIEITIPSGNFGNALGGYYAKKMGVPISKILITSNQNNILTELITKGEYNLKNKKVILTSSPAMDILKSSNVERVLYDMFGAIRTKELMDDLNTKNIYTLKANELAKLREVFDAYYSNDDEVKEVVKSYFDEGYLMDPHTATTIKAYRNKKNKKIKMVCYSTAEWTKFSPMIANALNNQKDIKDEKALADIAKKANIKIPNSINALFTKEIKHTSIIEKTQIESEILKFIRS